MEIESSDQIALIDLDGTLADYDTALREKMQMLQAPEEPPYAPRSMERVEPPHIEARRRLIQAQPGFWRSLRKLPLGFEVIEELKAATFRLYVLTKGPRANGAAWGEKLDWCLEHLPDAIVTVTQDKSLVYGKILFDDYPPYFMPWLKHRPRGLVVCLATSLNAEYAKGGPKEHPNVFRYDGSNRDELRARIHRARERASREAL
ncbi:5' nucleotidase, NT5C type [Pendulispora albinea]|uniref:Uncharacterized protein n=1 Tax=Pendulispora albinea TaxID=2741071 RepID=A0ABZ2MAJ1_9BACT